MLRRSHWALSIGGAGFLVGSLVVGSVGLASAGPPIQTVTANQGAAGTSPWPITGNVGVTGSLPSGSNTIGNVGVTGSLPSGSNTIGNVGVTGSLPSGSNTIGNVGLAAGSNDIGTVHTIATPNSVMDEEFCNVADGQQSCNNTNTSSGEAVINTLSAACTVRPGQHVNMYVNLAVFSIEIPLTFEATINGRDNYGANLTNLGLLTGSFISLNVHEDYTAGAYPDGAICDIHTAGTS
jgi:hypothetical protein